MNEEAIMGETNKIAISANVAAPIERVWTAYTEAAAIAKWNFASEDWHCPRAEIDLRVGGKHKARMEAKDGSFGFDFEAEYEEVAKHEAIALAMTDGRKARTTFEKHGTGTLVAIVFDADRQHSIELQRDGWQAILGNFKRYAEGS
jgi:uncharacterized protein YndB with AHSA1/START domain